MNDKEHQRHRLIYHTNGKSLEEINGTVEVPKNVADLLRTRCAGRGWLHGPWELVNVNYWRAELSILTDFGYSDVQSDCNATSIYVSKIRNCQPDGFSSGYQARTSKTLGIVLWILTELAIMATDIAEVIGAAIALYLLFNIPLILAVFITVLDVFLLLLLTRIGFRKIEALVICLILVILAIFAYQVALSNPDWKGIIEGFIPNNRTFASSPTVAGMSPLKGALGIIGATVMPHNLYLHSSISFLKIFV